MKILKPKQTLKACTASSLLLLTLFGCSSDDSDNEGYTKLVNYSKDAPSIYLTVDEDLDSDSDDDDDHYEQTYTGVSYGSAHSNITLDEDTYEYQLAWADDDSTDVDDLNVINEGTLKIDDETIHMVVLSGSILSPDVTIYDIPVIDDDEDDDDDLFNLRLLNMHSGEEAVDFYISEDDETFNEATLVASSVSFGELTENQKVDQEDYFFYITLAGSEEVVFTSTSIPFSYSSQNIMIARDNASSGTSDYVLDKMSDSSLVEYVDTNAEAEFRVYNAVANHDFFPDYQQEFALHINGVTDTPVVASLPFGEVSEALRLDSGDYSLDLTTLDGSISLLSNHLLTVVENANKTVFMYAEEQYYDEDGDGDIDEDDNGEIDPYEIYASLYSLVIDNSLLTSIYSHEIEIVNLIQSDDFSQVDVYFVRSDETIDTATYSREVNYQDSNSVTLKNNTFQVYVVATENGSEILLTSFELILDEDSVEQYLVLETDEDSATGYKTTLFSQIAAESDDDTDSE